MLKLIERVLCSPHIPHSARMQFRKEMLEREIRMAMLPKLF